MEKKIDKYSFSLNQILGEGSFAKVYRGQNMWNKETIAVKMVDKKMINSDEYLRQGLLAEIRIMRKLKHPNVVGLIDVLETPNNYYLVQEFCDGGNLQTLLKQKKTIPESEAMNIFQDLVSGFVELIRQGVVHRDLKPANILVHQGKYKLADFGFAKCVANFQKDMLASAVGTPLYMSPQILCNERYTNKTDIWSMGFVFYQVLFGRSTILDLLKAPWTGVSIPQLLGNIRKQPLAFPLELPISQPIKELLAGCLKPNEEDRFSWDEILKHPVWNGAFSSLYEEEQAFVNNSVYIVNELRQKIFQDNIDFQKLTSEFNAKSSGTFTLEEFTQLIHQIDSQISKKEIEDFFKLFDSKGELIKKQQLLDWYQHQKALQQTQLQTNDQSFTAQEESKAQLPHLQQGPSQSLPEVFKKLERSLKAKNQTLEKIYEKQMKQENQMVEYQAFSLLLRKIDEKLGNEEVNQAFEFMDTTKSGEFSMKYFMEQMRETMQVAGILNQEKTNTWVLIQLQKQGNIHPVEKKKSGFDIFKI